MLAKWERSFVFDAEALAGTGNAYLWLLACLRAAWERELAKRTLFELVLWSHTSLFHGVIFIWSSAAAVTLYAEFLTSAGASNEHVVDFKGRVHTDAALIDAVLEVCAKERSERGREACLRRRKRDKKKEEMV
jgi:hypothetical protein